MAEHPELTKLQTILPPLSPRPKTKQNKIKHRNVDYKGKRKFNRGVVLYHLTSSAEVKISPGQQGTQVKKVDSSPLMIMAT